MYYLRAILSLTLVYLILTANLELSNIVVGVLLSVLVLLMMRPERRTMNLSEFLGSIVALLRYVGILLFDLLVSGVQVALMVLSPSMPIRPGIIAIPAQTESDLGAALSAHAITLTPGNLVVEMDDDHTMYTHCLDATDSAKKSEQAQKIRRELLDRIFP